MTLQTFLQLLIGGVSIGILYSLPALGITLIWNAAGVFNFANGEYVALAAYITYTLIRTLSLPFPLVLLIVIAVMFIFGVVIEKIIVGTLRSRGQVARLSLVCFIALSLTIRYACRFIWTSKPLTYRNPFGARALTIGGIRVMPHVFWVVGICLLFMGLLFILYKKTKVGIAMRATTQNRTAAALMGIRTNRITSIVFGLSASMAGIAGVLSGSIFYASMEMGLSFGTKAFASNIVGGFGSPVGAVLGGLIIGVVETFGANLVSSAMKDIVTFTLLLIFLLFKPKGLIKLEIVEKV